MVYTGNGEHYIFAIYRWSSEKMLTGLVESYETEELAKTAMSKLVATIPEDSFEICMCKHNDDDMGTIKGPFEYEMEMIMFRIARTFGYTCEKIRD